MGSLYGPASHPPRTRTNGHTCYHGDQQHTGQHDVHDNSLPDGLVAELRVETPG